MTVKPGTALRLWSDDAFGGALRSVDDLSSGQGRPAVRQPADRSVLRRGRRARGHARAAPGRAGAGPRLGRLGGHPVLRRHDEHRPRRSPCRTPLPDTTWIYELDRDARHRRVRRPAQRPPHRAAARADARHRRGGAGRRRGALLAGARPVRRQHGHAADACRLDGLPRRQRRGRAVLHRRRALPPGRGRGLRHRRRGRDDHDAHRRAHQGRRARLAADRGRHALDDRRLQPADGGLLADRQRRARALGRPSSTACTRWTPTSCARRSRRCRSPTSSTPTTASWSRRPSRCCRPPTPSAASTPTCVPGPARSAPL